MGMRIMRKCLSVGINDYTSAPLHGAVNDAEKFGSLVEIHGDGSANFDVNLFPNVPTKRKLLSLIKELFECDYETALFYFAGHGHFNGTGGYIVTPDTKHNDIGIKMDDILHIANQSRAKNKIIILDCCHAGAIGPSKLNGQSAAPISSGVTILTACTDIEKSK